MKMNVTMPDDDDPVVNDVGLAGLPRLNLPCFEFEVRGGGERRHIFDPIRQQYVRLSPEEWVRQHFLRYLTLYCAYPASLIAVEKGFQYQNMARRADIVVHDRKAKPFLMVECKAPAVSISQAAFDQISRYNRVVGARYLVVTNGWTHFCWKVEDKLGTYSFMDSPPAYEEA